MNRKIEKEIEKERKEIEKIEKDIAGLKEKLLEKIPEHFSERDIINAFFGSLLVGVTFILKGAVLKTSQFLTSYHVFFIILSTIVILYAEIYFIGYVRVKQKKTRKIGQFIAKRFFTFLIISYLTSIFLIYVMGVNFQVVNIYEVAKLVVLISMPCSIGAAIPGLLKKY